MNKFNFSITIRKEELEQLIHEHLVKLYPFLKGNEDCNVDWRMLNGNPIESPVLATYSSQVIREAINNE